MLAMFLHVGTRVVVPLMSIQWCFSPQCLLFLASSPPVAARTRSASACRSPSTIDHVTISCTKHSIWETSSKFGYRVEIQLSIYDQRADELQVDGYCAVSR